MPWRAWHLHYHGDQDLLITRCLVPHLTAALREGAADRFFFVRYGLGGPHVRWRLHVHDAASGERLQARLHGLADGFFTAHPAAVAWTADEIRHHNARLIASDPQAQAAALLVVPNHHVATASYVAETHRYGGSAFASATHDLFTLSSLAALHTLCAHATVGRAAKLEVFLAHAVGATDSPESLCELLRHPPEAAWRTFETSVERADAVYQRQPEVYRQLVRRAIERHIDGDAGDPLGWLSRGASYLATLLDEASSIADALQVKSSHLHMSANRLGMSNAEELFFARLVLRACDDGRGIADDFGPWAAPATATVVHQQLRALVDDGLVWLTQSPLSASE